MADLAIIVPTRGRPAQLADMLTAVTDTVSTDVAVYVAVDEDDPAVVDGAYAAAVMGKAWPNVTVYRGPRKSLSGWTNHLATQALGSASPPRYLASLGDDHRPRSKGWDGKLIGAIEAGAGFGFAYGNDLLQGERLPTAWVVSADVVRELGWMMLPACEHMHVDNAVLELGRAAGCITYRPDVIVEHLHPVAGKAPWDVSYRESNTPARYEADGAAFEAWRTSDAGLAADVARLRQLVAV